MGLSRAATAGGANSYHSRPNPSDAVRTTYAGAHRTRRDEPPSNSTTTRVKAGRRRVRYLEASAAGEEEAPVDASAVPGA